MNASSEIAKDRDREPEGTRVRGAIVAISKYIRTAELGPGDRLPSEAAISQELSVSRSVVREAIQSLAAMRLIDVKAGKRATVAKIDYGAMSPMIEHAVGTEQISVQQIYDVRRTVESRTAALAALRRTDAEGQSILDLAKAMNAHLDAPEIVMERDLAFHFQIARASKNPVYALIIGAFENVTRQTWPIGWRSRTTQAEQQHMIDVHVQIGEAIAEGNPNEASRLMTVHFDVSVQALLAAGLA